MKSSPALTRVNKMTQAAFSLNKNDGWVEAGEWSQKQVISIY